MVHSNLLLMTLLTLLSKSLCIRIKDRFPMLVSCLEIVIVEFMHVPIIVTCCLYCIGRKVMNFVDLGKSCGKFFGKYELFFLFYLSQKPTTTILPFNRNGLNFFKALMLGFSRQILG